jgi:protein-S-isoprenylcysteine O-methyltransferase Ste14
MAWVPELEIGLWNAWILTFHPLLFPLLMVVLDMAGIGDIGKKMGEVPYEKSEKRAFMAFIVVMLLLIAYSVFLPLKLGTVWFYVGFTLYLVGLGLYLTAVVNIVTTPLGQPWTKGIYRYSRHPMTFSIAIAWTGASIASGSWILLLLSVIFLVLQKAEATAEERGCLETYGDEYQEYMNRTPRWIGIPKTR